MNITIIAVGKIKEKYLKEGLAEYIKRLSRFCNIKIVEISDEKAPEGISAAQQEGILLTEGEKIQKSIKDNTYIICLDVNGKRFTSEAFAKEIESCMLNGKSDITFIIGGSLGLHKSVKEKAGILLSMSDMTFPHQLTRLILSEQLFRVFKIINGETYHK